jgi:GWxTD domain-containing protein
VAQNVAAQTPVQRDSIQAFRDSIAEVQDTVALSELESAMIDVARVDRDNALLHVKLGFLAYRLGELTGVKQHLDDAGSEFEWAADLEPDWPYPWYGLGLAELAMGEVSMIALENIRQALGLDYMSKAAHAFGMAAQADPAFANAVVDLAETAMAQRVRPRLELALGAVREASRTTAAGIPEVQLARGRIERMVGEGDSALVAFEQYLALGGDSGIGYLEVARTLFYVNQPQPAESLYYGGAPLALSAEAVEATREDLSWVATPDELESFDLTPPEERADWLRAFWVRRDIAEARAPGDRLEEHYRRYFYALNNYTLVTRHRRYGPVNPFRTEQQVFDDRGIIYIRHGEPDERAFFNAPGVDPNESWLYARPEENQIFHFVAAGDLQDYKLVESLTDILGLEVSIQVQASGRGDPRLSDLYLSRMTMDPVYQRLATTGSAGQGRVMARERQMGEHAIASGTTSDSYRLRFGFPIDATVQHYVVGDPDGDGGQVMVVFAIPGSAVAAQPLGERLAYPVQMRIVASSRDDDFVAYLDTTRVFMTSEPIGPHQHLSGYLSVPVPYGEYVVRVVLGQPWRNVGEVHLGDGTVVPDFGADSLTLSDLIVGRESSGLRWRVGDRVVNLNPLKHYPQGADLDVYYEVYGLERGTQYRTRLEVKKQGGGSIFSWIGKLFGGGGPPISLSFEGVSEGRETRVLRQVDISSLKPGEYRLKIVVEDPVTGVEVEREAELEVVQ